MKILIIAGGDIEDYSFARSYADDSDYIICADRGISHARAMSLVPDLIVGDFDSASKEDMHYYQDKNIIFKSFPSKKDKTDTELALDIAIEKNPREIYIIGGTGNRLDHTLANIHLLYYGLQKKIAISLITSTQKIYLIDKEITLKGEKGNFVSLIPFSLEVHGVTTKGLEYPLNEAVLYSGSSYGISNVMTASTASICIKAGFLLVIQVLKE
ncbi:MAG: thiamine diphosphokinase [Epulopiscium sp.]|nr:thiamine diphosphokinase [Candidatus Epulonipiscium sp.]HOQ15916.1 thiamine diphosphokinase [Defluviitaleaceae bacterium]HPT76141.1 thiamine diphosphokinase [Defluviitaleaceae bacterium]